MCFTCRACEWVKAHTYRYATAGVLQSEKIQRKLLTRVHTRVYRAYITERDARRHTPAIHTHTHRKQPPALWGHVSFARDTPILLSLRQELRARLRFHGLHEKRSSSQFLDNRKIFFFPQAKNSDKNYRTKREISKSCRHTHRNCNLKSAHTSNKYRKYFHIHVKKNVFLNM